MERHELTERNRKIAQAMYDAAATGDVEGFFAPMSPDVVVKEPTFVAHGGTHYGIAALQALTAEVVKVIDLTSMVVDELVADGERVLAFCRLRPVDGDGEIRLVEALRLKDDVIVEMDVYWNDSASIPLKSKSA